MGLYHNLCVALLHLSMTLMLHLPAKCHTGTTMLPQQAHFTERAYVPNTPFTKHMIQPCAARVHAADGRGVDPFRG